MSLDGGPLWTEEQHGWLQALGHTVWVPGSLPVAESAAPPMRAAEPRPARPLPLPRESAPPVARRPAPPAPVEAQAEAPRRPAPPRRAGARLHDTLHFEVIRASGLNPNAPDAAAIIASWPAAAELRGNPAAKRALWPRLRALRKAPQ
ncbi:hypothetical protein SAMN05428989_0125 [Pseudoxanthomonas sp. GM95]|uniref:hypothetical protein n=1 Tax=Pseudoxanthomonas sp. GM95 TaxID=1881043 RepID=UPI0008B306FC|nr:hypothetical protein [Pseudoxanthomonas sp. GM95]SEK44116.1 hypothetical protein SAMN05428989_0125 [Pseudoxanthomonas sp. GM95]